MRLKKLNSKGFGHLEILLVVAVVVVLGAVGYFVWQHEHKNNTAHAGSYNYTRLGSSSFKTVTVYANACKINMPSTYYGPLYQIETLYTLSPSPSNSSAYSVIIYNSPTAAGKGAVVSSNNTWLYNTVASTSFYLSQLSNNYLTVDYQEANVTTHIGLTINAKSLVNC